MRYPVENVSKNRQLCLTDIAVDLCYLTNSHEMLEKFGTPHWSRLLLASFPLTGRRRRLSNQWIMRRRRRTPSASPGPNAVYCSVHAFKTRTMKLRFYIPARWPQTEEPYEWYTPSPGERESTFLAGLRSVQHSYQKHIASYVFYILPLIYN